MSSFEDFVNKVGRGLTIGALVNLFVSVSRNGPDGILPFSAMTALNNMFQRQSVTALNRRRVYTALQLFVSDLGDSGDFDRCRQIFDGFVPETAPDVPSKARVKYLYGALGSPFYSVSTLASELANWSGFPSSDYAKIVSRLQDNLGVVGGLSEKLRLASHSLIKLSFAETDEQAAYWVRMFDSEYPQHHGPQSFVIKKSGVSREVARFDLPAELEGLVLSTKVLEAALIAVGRETLAELIEQSRCSPHLTAQVLAAEAQDLIRRSH